MSKVLHNKKDVRQEVNRMTGPIFIELLLGTLFGMVDMMMLGNYGDPTSQAAAIAAVGITNQYMFIGLSLVQALNTGATAMVARYLGAGHVDRIESVVKHIMILTQVVIVIPFIIIGLGFTLPLMKFLGAHSDTIAIGSNYFRVIMVGFIFQAYNFSIVASLRGVGDTRTPMGINITSNLLNVFGNAVLIYGLFGFPELGATGAAISTALSHVFAGVLFTRYILKENSTIHIDLRHKFNFNKDIIYNITKIGVPASLEQVAMRAGILIFSRIIASLGTVAYATHQIAINILSLSFTPGQAFGISASTLTGRSLGEEDSDLAEKYIRGCSSIGAIIAFTMGVGFYFLGGHIASLYTDNQEVIREAASVLKLIAFIQPFQTSQLIIAGGLRGAGDTVWTLISTFVGILVIRVALAYYFVMVLGIGLMGAWIAIFIDQFMRWVMITLRFRTDKWKYITIR